MLQVCIPERPLCQIRPGKLHVPMLVSPQTLACHDNCFCVFVSNNIKEKQVMRCSTGGGVAMRDNQRKSKRDETISLSEYSMAWESVIQAASAYGPAPIKHQSQQANHETAMTQGEKGQEGLIS